VCRQVGLVMFTVTLPFGRSFAISQTLLVITAADASCICCQCQDRISLEVSYTHSCCCQYRFVCWARLQCFFVASKYSHYKYASCQDVHGRVSCPQWITLYTCIALQKYHLNRPGGLWMNGKLHQGISSAMLSLSVKFGLKLDAVMRAWLCANAALTLSTRGLEACCWISQLCPSSCCNWINTAYNVSSFAQRYCKHNALYSLIQLCLNANCFWLWVLVNQTLHQALQISASLQICFCIWHVVNKLSNEP